MSKLAKLVTMLSSPHDAEVVAAARAITQELRKHKKDWHDLADAADRMLPARAQVPNQTFQYGLYSEYTWEDILDVMRRNYSDTIRRQDEHQKQQQRDDSLSEANRETMRTMMREIADSRMPLSFYDSMFLGSLQAQLNAVGKPEISKANQERLIRIYHRAASYRGNPDGGRAYAAGGRGKNRPR